MQKTKEKKSIFYFLFSIFLPKKAFTLIETIIYIALFSLIAGFVMIVFYQLLGGQERQRSRSEVHGEANFIMQKMLWALTGAERIVSPTGGATSTTLTVDLAAAGENLVTFDINGDDLRINDSGVAASLNSRHVSVGELLFTHIKPIESSREGVKIRLKVVSLDAIQPQASTTLEHTIYLR